MADKAAAIFTARPLRQCEIRAVNDGKSTKLTGYAAVFNSPSEDMGGWVEVIKPGSFSRMLREKQDVRCLLNHDENCLLGRVSSGTLTMSEDARGLFFECTLPDTQDAKDVVTLIDRKDIAGCSFRFCINRSNPEAPGAQWLFGQGGGPDVRQLLDLDVIDVGPCSDPAYLATEVSARSYREAKDEAEKLRSDATGAQRLRMARLQLAEADL